MRATAALLVAMLGLVSVLPSCGKPKKLFPDASPGRHSPDYSVIFGRLQREPSKDPDAPPLWMIRYGFGDSDGYGGKLNLAPPEKLAGYSGGELVQITGRIRKDWTHPEFAGTWYEVQGIRVWSGTGYK